MSDPTGHESQEETELGIEAMQVVIDLRAEIEWLEKERVRLVGANEHWHRRVSELTTSNEAWSQSDDRLREVLDAASLFASQGHRKWCEIDRDHHAPRISCSCGLREFEDARAALHTEASTESEGGGDG